jgi:hypothetical protein
MTDSVHSAETSLELHAGTAGVATRVTPLTPQQVFDNALHGVIAQGWFSRSRGEGSTCAYRGQDGFKCGIGHSIPDSLYKKEFDAPPRTGPLSLLYDNGTDIGTLCEVAPQEIGAVFAKCSNAFLSAIQEAHDNAGDMADFRQRMQMIATRHGLTYTEPADSGVSRVQAAETAGPDEQGATT